MNAKIKNVSCAADKASRMVPKHQRAQWRDDGTGRTSTIYLEVDGCGFWLSVQKHAGRQYAARFGDPVQYAFARAGREIRKLITENIDLFDEIVTTREHSFAVLDKRTGSVWLGQLWTDLSDPEVFISTYWYGRPFHADNDDRQVIVERDGSVHHGSIFDEMQAMYAD